MADERIGVGDLVQIKSYVVNERFKHGLEANPGAPVRVIAFDKYTGLVTVAPQPFDQPFHENELIKVASAPTPPATQAKR